MVINLDTFVGMSILEDPINDRRRILMPKIKSHEEWIADFEKVHGNEYDYSKAKIKTGKDKIEIICKKHGSFLQIPENHRQGKKCLKCSYELRGQKHGDSRESFIDKAKARHGNSYDYSKVVYRGSEVTVEILCPKHGSFMQTPKKHISGQGCRICGIDRSAEKQRKSDQTFLEEAKQVHGEKYIYNAVVYVDAKTNVIITCRKHGIFKQTPNNHLDGKGCPICRDEMLSETRRKPAEAFIAQANEVHKDAYDYSRTIYLKNNIKVTIGCKIHGFFSQIPSNHLNGVGCPSCADLGFAPNAPTIAYFVKVSDSKNSCFRYKLGVTNRSVKERFKGNDAKLISPLHEKSFERGSDALLYESKLLEKYDCCKYKGPALLSSGNSELFNVDIWLMEQG